MEKVLVEVYVPVIDHAYDIFIPLKSPMYEVLELIKKAVSDLSDGRFVSTGSTAICNRNDGTIININLSIKICM